MNISEIAKMFATDKHKMQHRKNGSPYITHPISVANLLLKYKKSHNINRLLAAAYLHDTLEDTDTSYYELVDVFGYDIAGIVMELTTNEDMKNDIGKNKYLAYKLNSMTKWALAIKLCDRLDNVSDLETMDESFRKRYMEETAFIIDYICEHRELSNTHREIIKDIAGILKTIKTDISFKHYTL
jgi:Guanosine polyphosphate pyrophosphohydrolases/synthetases